MKVIASNGTGKGQYLGYHWITGADLFSEGESVVFKTVGGRIVPKDEALKHEIEFSKDFLWPVWHSRAEVADWLTNTMRLRNSDALYRKLYSVHGKDLPPVIERKEPHPGAKPIV